MATNTISETRYDTNNFWKENLNSIGTVTSGTLTWAEILDSTSVKTTEINSSSLSSGSAGPMTEALDGDTASYTIQRGTKVDEEFFESPEQFRGETGNYTGWYVGNSPLLDTWYVSVTHNGVFLAHSGMTYQNMTKDEAYGLTEIPYGENTTLTPIGEPTILKKGSLQVEHAGTREAEFALIQKYPTSKTYEIILNGTSETVDPPPVAPPPPPPAVVPTPVIPPAPTQPNYSIKSAEDLATGMIRNQTISVKVSRAPATIQSLRKQVIQNAIMFARELKEHKFNELGEIIRVCTALGVERAFLRGLQYAVLNEEQIDRHIYRFDLTGAVPFVDRETGQIPTDGKIYFTPTNKAMMFFCYTNDSKSFASVTNNVASFVVEGSVNTKLINSELVQEQILPDYAMIPKYRSKSTINGIEFTDDVSITHANSICKILQNHFESESENCITTIEVADLSVEIPQPNTLISVHKNQFPYLTPGPGFPFDLSVYPEPIRIRRVIDGVPIDNEQLILANRFELTGTVKIDPGIPLNQVDVTDNGDGTSTVVTDPDDLPPGIIKIDDLEIPNKRIVPVALEYHGPALFILDPVEGDGTLFQKELDVGDVIEIKRDETIINGSFLTNGTDYIYYTGKEFIEKVNRSSGNINIKLNDFYYTIVKNDSGNQSELDQEYELNHVKKKHKYNAKYKVQVSSSPAISTSKSKFLAEQTLTVDFIRDELDPFKGEIQVTGGLPANTVLSELFEPFETFKLSKLNIATDNANPIDNQLAITEEANVDMSFGEISDVQKKFLNCFRFDISDTTKSYKLVTTKGITLTRSQKITGHLKEFTGATELPNYTYHTVSNISSDTKMDISPDASESFEGKITRIGFCAYSQSASPNLLGEGLEQDIVAQILKNGSQDNSPEFHMPQARTDKVVIYKPSDIVKETPQTTSENKIDSPHDVIESYGMRVYNAATDFNLTTGRKYEESEIQNDFLNEQIVGTLYVRRTDNQDFITIESLDEDFKPASHGFAEDDMLRIYRKLNSSKGYGDMVDGTEIVSANNVYSKCGLMLQVITVKSPYRFEIDFDQKLSEWFTAEENKIGTSHLRATNGRELEYWNKYFEPLYLDGTTDYSGTTGSEVTLTVPSKFDDENLLPNYDIDKHNYNVTTGIIPITITSDPNGMGGFTIATTNTDADAFIFVPKDQLSFDGPGLMDVFQLRSAKFGGG